MALEKVIKTTTKITQGWKFIMLKTSKKNVLISILCITYNHEKYIAQALDGFISQKTSFPFEVIVHDDASTDGTTIIIKDYEKKYPHLIKPIYERNNLYSRGISILRRCLTEFCNGKYIALCEGDDYWTDPQKLEKQISFMEHHPECTMTYHPVNYVSNGVIIGNDINGKVQKVVSVKELIQGGGAFCASPSLVFRRSVGIEYPKFRTMADVGDYPLQILAGLRGKVYYFPTIMGCYRKNHAGSWTTTVENNPQKAIQHWNNEISWLTELDKETNGQLSDAISYRVAFCKICLYQHDGFKYEDLKISINSIRNEKDKAELKILKRRIMLIRAFPFLYKVYKSIVNNLLLTKGLLFSSFNF